MMAPEILWLLVIGLPLVGAAAVALTQGRRPGWVVLTVVPALVAVARAPVGDFVHYPGLLLGCTLGLDEIAQLFLAFTAVIWFFALAFAAGYITTHRVSFFGCMLTAMAGNFGLILSQDMPSYYLFFALMSFASYGVIIHRREPPVLRAGRVYLVLVVVGEVLIFSGMVGLAGLSGTTEFARLGPGWLVEPLAPLILGALLLGFGIKAGALPLHVWLPLAHPAAPSPASAVLSGTMIKAGLLGWIRFLPVGQAALPDWGDLLVAAGLAASLLSTLFGFFQNQPKTVLAYSSIGKMGLMTMAFGVALQVPEAAPVVLAAVGIFALDHALTKSTMFLGCSIHPGQGKTGWQRGLLRVGLVLPALSLAGFACTGGLVAKTIFKTPLAGHDGGSLPAEILSYGVPAASLGAVLLVARYLWVHFRQPAPDAPGAIAFGAWGIQTLLVGGLPMLYLYLGHRKQVAYLLNPDAILQAAWPILAAAAAMLLATRFRRLSLPSLPAGDLLVVYQVLLKALAGAGRWTGTLLHNGYRRLPLARLRSAVIHSVRAETIHRTEEGLGQFWVSGGIFLLVLALFVLALCGIPIIP